MLAYKAVYGQSLFDVCLNTYGTFDYLAKLLIDNNVENIDITPYSGQIFNWDEMLVADQQVNITSQNSKIIYATSVIKNGSVLSVIESKSQGGGISIPNYYQPPNQISIAKYQITLETEYIAEGGETEILISDLIGASIIQITRETQPLKINEFSFNTNNGQITFIVSPLNEYETIYIIYSKMITE